jgi:hypothetical protein
MKAPKCKLCGHEHWSREPCVFEGKQPEGFKPIPKSVKTREKLPAFVTKPIASNGVAGMKSKAATSQLAEMESEIKQLKRELAKANADLAKRVDTTAKPVDTTPVASTGECPTCKARREAKTAAQKKWRKDSAARSAST